METRFHQRAQMRPRDAWHPCSRERTVCVFPQPEGPKSRHPVRCLSGAPRKRLGYFMGTANALVDNPTAPN
eukprot:scaffold625_cov420-Prasinococcus_capsulatus_cf.AAC.38